MPRAPPAYTLFPYTTLFRSLEIYRNEQLFAKGRELSGYFLDAMFALQDLPAVNDVRGFGMLAGIEIDRKSTRLNSSHSSISYAVFCLKKKTTAHCLSTDGDT